MSDAPLVHRPSADVPAMPGPAEWFSGQVTIETLSNHDDIAASALRVSFAPGARTAWHTHPAGQILLVTSGNGLVATREWSRRMSAGDVVEIPAGVEHWHGAASATPMQHLAIQPDPATAWLELVGDDEHASAERDG